MALMIHQSCTVSGLRRVPIHLVSGTNGLTKSTGATASQFQISKRGGAFGTSTASLIEVGNGLYYAQLTAAQLDTLGFLVVRAKTSKTAEAQTMVQVVPWNPYVDTSDRLRVQVHGMATGTIAAATFANDALTSRAIAAKAIHRSALATRAIHTTAMATGSINLTAFANKSIHQAALATGAIHVTALAAKSIHTSALATFAIHTTALAAKAIHVGAMATGSINATAMASGSIRTNTLASGALTSRVPSSGFLMRGADWTLKRSLGNSATSADGQTASGRNLLQGTRMLSNRTLLSASFVVYKENDTTVAFRKAVTVAAGVASQVITDLDTV